MGETLGRRDLLLASGAVLAGTVGAGRAEETPGRLKFMVLGAHPDDPETGCGGTMARLADLGHEVVSAYLTRGEAGIPGTAHDEAARIRMAEAEQACAILGARPLFLGQVDGATEVNATRYDEVRQVLSHEAPDVVFSHWPVDTHRDHRAAALLTYDAWWSLGRPSALYYFEVMAGHQTQAFHPTHFVDIGPTVKRKHEACFAHRSQNVEEWYADDHGRMEVFRGMEALCDVAEAFVHHPQSPEGPGLPPRSS
ncbi:MAG: PIG-L family deacetylase [Acidobacteria bacterium]|jgi:LmbE family N-acetylglucosaminyl deacetylase|nr:PIG-L family deacetylase [Acidobacteriota bacterium]